MSTIQTIAILLLIVLVYIVVLVLLVRAIFWMVFSLYSLLSKFAWFKRVANYIFQYITELSVIFTKWRQRNLPTLVNIFEENYELFGDITVIGFALAVMVNRVHDIQISASNWINFLRLLVLDMMINNVILWFIFGILLGLWLLGKRRKYLIEKNHARENKLALSDIKKTLESLNTKMGNLDTTLSELSKSITNLNIRKR